MGALEQLVRRIRSTPAFAAKRELAVLNRLGAALDGDDAAAIPSGEGFLLLCGEAIQPAFVRGHPRAAGAAAVVTNLADVRAVGTIWADQHVDHADRSSAHGAHVGVVDMLISPDRAHAELVLE